MDYKILDTKYNSSRLNLKISFVPSNDVLNTFFASLDVIKLSKVLQHVLKSESYFQSPMSLRFYKDLDWEDLQELDEIGGVKEDELVVYHEVYGDTIIKESLFCQILLDYSTKLLEVYKDDPALPAQWSDEVLIEINQLKIKMESQV
jgi:hypothetical protein